ncbi:MULTISPECIES: EamA family transporter [Synergistaceae]|uniref:EamA family transporter n=1 Tax=Synergistaceae TaxID=649777 RepID=UPI003AED1535
MELLYTGHNRDLLQHPLPHLLKIHSARRKYVHVVNCHISCCNCLKHFFYLFSVQDKGIMLDMKSLNWTSILLGVGVFGIELGFIKMYRAGWNISAASLLTNAAISILLIFIGLIFYKEHLSSNQIIGIALCLAGLFFFNR